MVMYKHINTRTGTITLTDADGKFHVMFPGGTVTMNRIYEGKGIICVNKDADDKSVDFTLEQEEKPKRKLKKKEGDD